MKALLVQQEQQTTEQKLLLERIDTGAEQLLKYKLLSEVELQILRNELSSPLLKHLNKIEQNNQLLDVISEIKILTGVLMCSGAELKIQIDILSRFMIAHPIARNLTISEIRHAFYLNSFGEFSIVIRHYNRELNAEFIGDILMAYQKLKARFLIRSRDIIRALLYPVSPVEKAFVSEELLQEMIQKDFENYKIGNTLMIFNVKMKYNFLRKKALILLSSKAIWERNYRQAMQYRAKEYLASNDQVKERVSIYRSFEMTGIIPLKEHRQIIIQTRKIIYFKFFKLLADTAIHNIFVDIEY